MVATVKRNWDRTNQCCRADCVNPRGSTRDGVASMHCQMHTDEWQIRLDALAAKHPASWDDVDERPRHAPVFTPPPPLLADVGVCAHCGSAPRDFPDNLCEECRRGHR